MAVVHAFRRRHDDQGGRDHPHLRRRRRRRSDARRGNLEHLPVALGPELRTSSCPGTACYVYYFERIVRQVSGRAGIHAAVLELHLVRSRPARRAAGAVPHARRSAVRLPVPPRTHARWPTAASRSSTNQPGDAMDISDAMAKTSYSTVGSVQGFCRAIDSGIHGRIHVLVGNSKGMGAVPYAGQRSAVLRAPRQHRPHVGELEQERQQEPADAGDRGPTAHFVFADANGVRVSRQLSTVFSVLGLGYDYDAFIPGPPPPRDHAAPARRSPRRPTPARRRSRRAVERRQPRRRRRCT